METPVCSKCQDTGYISRDIGGLAVSDRCPCIAERTARRIVENAGIPARYALASFGTFIVPDDIHHSVAMPMRGILMQLETFVRNFFPVRPGRSRSIGGLLLYGANGTGKTHLAISVFRQILLNGGVEGRFINYQALLRVIKASYDKPFGRSDRTTEYDALETTDLLLLDDLGSNRVTDWVQDTITDLVSQRYDNELPMIVTTNYAVEKGSMQADTLGYLGDQIGERATSRLRQMCTPIAMPSIGDYRNRREAR